MGVGEKVADLVSEFFDTGRKGSSSEARLAILELKDERIAAKL
jgi:hypothetical protein